MPPWAPHALQCVRRLHRTRVRGSRCERQGGHRRLFSGGRGASLLGWLEHRLVARSVESAPLHYITLHPMTPRLDASRTQRPCCFSCLLLLRLKLLSLLAVLLPLLFRCWCCLLLPVALCSLPAAWCLVPAGGCRCVATGGVACYLQPLACCPLPAALWRCCPGGHGC